MPIIMSRIDERLIHGQMALSWLKAYDVDKVIVIDDDSANDEMKTMLLEMSVSGRVKCIVCTESKAAGIISSNMNDSLFLCTAKPSVFLHLLEQGIKIPDVNVGGIYDAAGRRQLYKNIFVDDEIKNSIIAMEKFSDTKVEYRMMPHDFPTDIIKDLKKM